MDGDSNTTQKTSNPIPCANQCGFFGNPLTDNLCSKCFRDLRPKKDNNDNILNTNNNTNNTIKKEVEKPSNNTVVVETNNKIVEDASTSTKEDKETEEVKKVQTDTTKCFSCNKKVGLLGFKCRCSFTYCSAHRYSNKHDCDFDYKADAKEKLAKDNPIVMASKINKI